jgi:hypothetical protein
MEWLIDQHCRRLGASLDKIRRLDPHIYDDVVFLLAAAFAVDADNQELRKTSQSQN